MSITYKVHQRCLSFDCSQLWQFPLVICNLPHTEDRNKYMGILNPCEPAQTRCWGREGGGHLPFPNTQLMRCRRRYIYLCKPFHLIRQLWENTDLNLGGWRREIRIHTDVGRKTDTTWSYHLSRGRKKSRLFPTVQPTAPNIPPPITSVLCPDIIHI